MRIGRFVHHDQPVYGIIDDEHITVLAGDPFFQKAQPTATKVPLEDARLLSPIIPRSKVVGIGRNWAEHAAELGNEVPTSPLMFFKPNTSVVGPGDPVSIPSWTEQVSYEAELAVVIGKIAKDIPAERASEVLFGYTVGNDLTARDVQATEKQWARAKGFDGACPLGPWIETEIDVEDVRIRSWVDGELRQDGTTADMIFDIPTLIEYVSRSFTLLPGDVLLTGTPPGVGIVDDGQEIECEVEGIGSLVTVLRR